MRSHFCGLIDEALVGQTVTLCGWADVARNMGQIVFIDLRDHEGIVQIVAEPAETEGNAAVLAVAASACASRSTKGSAPDGSRSWPSGSRC